MEYIRKRAFISNECFIFEAYPYFYPVWRNPPLSPRIWLRGSASGVTNKGICTNKVQDPDPKEGFVSEEGLG